MDVHNWTSETVSMDVGTVAAREFAHQIEVKGAVLVAEEYFLPVVASLRNMMRKNQAGRIDEGLGMLESGVCQPVRIRISVF